MQCTGIGQVCMHANQFSIQPRPFCRSYSLLPGSRPFRGGASNRVPGRSRCAMVLVAHLGLVQSEVTNGRAWLLVLKIPLDTALPFWHSPHPLASLIRIARTGSVRTKADRHGPG